MITIRDNLITIDTDNTTYQMKVSEYGHLLHTFYGDRTSGDMSYLLNYCDRGFSPNPYDVGNNRGYTMDTLPQEYACFGNGDFRTVSLRVSGEDGRCGIDLRYKDARIVEGKYSIDGLPAAYACEGEHVETLVVELEDVKGEVEVSLYYGVFEHLDVITRAARICNTGQNDIIINKAASMQLDLHRCNYDIIHLRGRYGMERMHERNSLSHGRTVFSSERGESSHNDSPFVALADSYTDETHGDVYGFALLYSGNFASEIEVTPYEQLRVVMGISGENFGMKLGPKECFDTPEAVMTFSSHGLEQMSYNFHRLVRNNICRGAYKLSRRPVLINNWEATYFDFTGKKLIDIARQAAELGVELFVLDDGWFGNRNSDLSGLGDWFVNEEKLGMTLKSVADNIRGLGMKFGLWIEPEMVNEDSELYEEHPDYAFAIPGRNPVRSRSQLVLDFSRKEVVDNIFEQVAGVIDATGVDYLKIDMNRSIHEVYSYAATYQNRGALLHGYVMGMYDFLERLCKRYPDMLIEGCSGGGGRYDMGMMYYVPQIWCSDNTDAIERISIQHGTSIAYPMSTVGAHVSAVPSHQTGRVTPIKTRGIVAMCGGFGYELDLNLVSDEDKEEVRRQIELYKSDWKTIQQGRYYRLTSPDDNVPTQSWEYVTEDGSKALLAMVQLMPAYNAPDYYVRLRGLDDKAMYRLVERDMTVSGAALMNAGIQLLRSTANEYESELVHIEIVND